MLTGTLLMEGIANYGERSRTAGLTFQVALSLAPMLRALPAPEGARASEV